MPPYSRPPIHELALSVQLDRMARVGTAHLGLLWERFRDEFPRVEEQLPLPPIAASLDLPKMGEVGIELLTAANPARLWFIDGPGAHLVQVQQDRIGFNWRRLEEAPEYPRYKTIRRRLRDAVDKLSSFLQEEQLDQARPTHCEITYINHVVPQDSGPFRSIGQIGSVLAPIDKDWGQLRLGVPEAAGCFFRYPLMFGSDEIGRTQLDCRPVVRKADGMTLLQISLVARARLADPTWDSVWRVLDNAHETLNVLFEEAAEGNLKRTWEGT